MANKTWSGAAQDGDFENAANWVGAVAPVATDRLFFTGDEDITTNCDQSGTAYAGWHFQGYTGKAGSSGNEMQCDISDFYYEGNDNSYIYGDIDAEAYVEGTGAGTLYLKGTGTDIDLLFVAKGTVVIAASSTIVALHATYQDVQATDVNLTINSGCTITTFSQSGGVVVSASTLATVDAHAGTLTFTGVAAATTVNLRGGSFYWSSSGDIGTINGWTGILDATGYSGARTLATFNRYGPVSTHLNSQGLDITNHNNHSEHGNYELYPGVVAIT